MNFTSWGWWRSDVSVSASAGIENPHFKPKSKPRPYASIQVATQYSKDPEDSAFHPAPSSSMCLLIPGLPSRLSDAMGYERVLA